MLGADLLWSFGWRWAHLQLEALSQMPCPGPPASLCLDIPPKGKFPNRQNCFLHQPTPALPGVPGESMTALASVQVDPEGITRGQESKNAAHPSASCRAASLCLPTSCCTRDATCTVSEHPPLSVLWRGREGGIFSRFFFFSFLLKI